MLGTKVAVNVGAETHLIRKYPNNHNVLAVFEDTEQAEQTARDARYFTGEPSEILPCYLVRADKLEQAVTLMREAAARLEGDSLAPTILALLDD